ncbi:MAG: hypothetical protein GC189_09055 [Alphaproteobacteria bacterium]|nr:hypothetical protein [Alphaproteobacteria bacterium]
MRRTYLRTLARLRALKRSRRGVAAVEFALIAPMMIFTLFGAVDMVDALGVAQRAENTASSIADVISRDNEISNAEMADIWTAADVLMFPSDSDNLQMRVSAVMITSSTEARVVWSDGHNGYAPRAVGSTVSFPANMMIPDTSLIYTETQYLYTPPLGMLFGTSVTMQHHAQRRSRIIDPVDRTN